MDSLRSFRRNAVHVRQALDLFQQAAGKIQAADGYLQNEGLVERYKRLSIPVRRALNPTDRASFEQALAELGATPNQRDAVVERLTLAWHSLQKDIDSAVVLGGSRVPRRQILMVWLDAAAFYDSLEREHAYDRMIDQYGKAAESIGAELTEASARLVLELDEAIAGALGEPIILPPPAKTPPPPPDPKEPWWKRLFGKA